MRQRGDGMQTVALVMLLPILLVWYVLVAIFMVIAGPGRRRKAFDSRWALAQRVHADRREMTSAGWTTTATPSSGSSARSTNSD
jgi:hypothetical protein